MKQKGNDMGQDDMINANLSREELGLAFDLATIQEDFDPEAPELANGVAEGPGPAKAFSVKVEIVVADDEATVRGSAKSDSMEASMTRRFFRTLDPGEGVHGKELWKDSENPENFYHAPAQIVAEEPMYVVEKLMKPFGDD